MDDGVPICYHREHVANFMVEKADLKWEFFKPDLAIGKVTKPHIAGLISFRLYFHNVTKRGPFDSENHPVWS